MPADLKIYRRSELEAIRPAADVEGCLHRYRAIWIDGVDDTTDLALVGIGFHAVQHAYILRLVEQQIPQDAEEANAAFVEGIAASQTPARLIPEIRKIWDFHVPHFELPLDRFVAAEERQTSGNVGWTPDLVLAHPDRNELEVVDFKSGWAPIPTEDDLRTNFQARVYSRYAQIQWPNFHRYAFTINAVRFGKRATVVFAPTELDSVDLELQASIAVIEEAKRTNHWPATAGPSCHFCTLACPIADQALTVPKRLLPAQRQTVASWVVAAEQILKEVKKVLKADCVANGPILVNGVEFANRPVVGRSYPAKPVVQALGTVAAVGGLDECGLGFSASVLKPFFKQFGKALEDPLAPTMQERTTYRFSGTKAGAAEDDSEE